MLLVVSPHLDDAVFSCAALIAAHPGATIVTAFAGLPEPHVPASHFDEHISPLGRDAVLKRRAEDHGAAAELGATVIHLDGLDAPYASDVPQRRWSDRLAEHLAGASATDIVLAPLGLRHPDHLMASWAVLSIPTAAEIWLYEELPYRILWPEFLELAWARVRGMGFRVTTTRRFAPPAVKAVAAQHYETQLPSTDPCVLDADELVHCLEHVA